MTMMRAILPALALLALPLAAAAEWPADPAHGLWLTENEKAIVEIAPCGDEVCGRTVWVENALDESGAPKRDAKNRPICGIELVGGMRREAEGAWSDGWVYNPRDGSTWSARLRALSPSELEVRGFLGVAALGRSQVWTRVDDDRGGCARS